MQTIKELLLINKFGQNLIIIDSIVILFNEFYLSKKKKYLQDIISLILQSKPIEDDIKKAILDTGLKSTYTPCVLLKKGIKEFNLKKIAELPESELNKSLVLLLELFKISYKRRFLKEMNDPDKWWYWDLSNVDNLRRIKIEYDLI